MGKWHVKFETKFLQLKNTAVLNKEREKNMENTKEIRKVNGKQYMTINAIAKISGIARDSLTNRFFRLKKAYPEHTCCFGSKIPVYYGQ